jgi:Lysozyme like domain
VSILTDAEIIALWITEGGSISSAASALAHAQAESSGSTTVTSANPDGGTNVGLYQLDTKGVGAGYTVAQLQNAALNTQLTVKGSNNGANWASWPDAWQNYISQADQAVAAFTAAAGSNLKAYALKVANSGKVNSALPAIPPGGSGGGPSSGPLADVTNAVGQASTLLGDAAKALDWFFHFFKPGQGWRIAFGAGAVLAGYGGVKSWMAATQSEDSTAALPLAVLLFALSALAAFMTLRQWPQPGGKPITPGAYAVDVLEGKAPTAGTAPASDAPAIEVGLGAILALWGASKAAQGLSGLGGLLASLGNLFSSGGGEAAAEAEVP